MSQALDARELAAMVDRFEAIAYDHILERGGRVVKMIGDEVMFAVEDGVGRGRDRPRRWSRPTRATPTLPDVRVGLASGPTLAWEGDLFGPTVNLASRLVNFARPETVLVSDELGERLHDSAAVHAAPSPPREPAGHRPRALLGPAPRRDEEGVRSL